MMWVSKYPGLGKVGGFLSRVDKWWDGWVDRWRRLNSYGGGAKVLGESDEERKEGWKEGRKRLDIPQVRLG